MKCSVLNETKVYSLEAIVTYIRILMSSLGFYATFEFGFLCYI